MALRHGSPPLRPVAVCSFVLPFLVVGPTAYAAGRPNGKLVNVRVVAGDQVRLNLRGNTPITFKLEA
jgi:hypothetical protein